MIFIINHHPITPESMILSEANALPPGLYALRAGSGAGGQYSIFPTFHYSTGYLMTSTTPMG
jgi:hypothetical protein